MRRVTCLLLLVMAALAACAAPSRPTPTPQPVSDEEAIRSLILAEGQGVVAQDLAALMELWAADAVITDAKHTPANTADDARWRGRDAIRDRYVVLVFPGNPQQVQARDIHIEITGDVATATSTTVIGKEVSPGGDRWTFVKREGRWWISSLTYNLEPR